MLQDAHLHIQDIKNPTALDAFITDTFAGGLQRFFNCAITPADWPLVKSYAERDPRVVPFFGFHPWFGDLADKKAFEKLAEYLAWPPALAGEMGLDRARKNLDFELQKEVFIGQLELAVKFQKPFAVHCVRAWAETIELIKKHAPGLKFLMHSFNGSKEIAQEIERMGGYFSVPVRQFLKAEDPFKEVFQTLPPERILMETDFPYQVKWTTPSDYIAAVQQGYAAAATWRGIPMEEFIKKAYDNGTVFTNRTADR
jgi:TatD DNase family protein